jgi:hypothetical protein
MMPDEEFEQGQSRVFEALKDDKSRCPEADALMRFAEGALDSEEAAKVNTHVSLCGLCLELVDRFRQPDPQVSDRKWKRIEKDLDRRSVPWRPEPSRVRSWWTGIRIPAAVAAALVVGVTLWMLNERVPVGPVSTTRGDLVQLQEPAGRIEKLGDFRWNEQPAAAIFRLQIREGEKVVVEIGLEGSVYRPSDDVIEVLRPGTPYTWRVQALDSPGNVVGESAWINFEIVSGTR